MANSAASLTGVIGASPVGTISMWASATPPTGWLICDGSALDASVDTKYQGLFNVIGITYGGADNTDFQLPNAKGKVVTGFDTTDTDFDALGETGGAKDGVGSHTHDTNIDQGGGGSSGISANPTGSSTSVPITTASAGTASGNLAPYITLHYIIKAENILVVSGVLAGAGLCSFSAHANAITSNGAGFIGVKTVAIDTEEFDVGGNFDTSTYTFTAPVTGKYLFKVLMFPTNTLIGKPDPNCQLVMTAETITFLELNDAIDNALVIARTDVSYIAEMTAGDTAYLQSYINHASSVNMDAGCRFQGTLLV